MCAVSNKMGNEQYWTGNLERGIVPEDCVWEYSGGTGQEGCILYLQKMNLELLRRSCYRNNRLCLLMLCRAHLWR